VVAKFNTPVVRVKLLNVVAFVPLMVAAFKTTTVPVPPVKVPLFVKTPAALKFKVDEAPKLNVPLLMIANVVTELDAVEKLNVPLLVIVLLTVIADTPAVTEALTPEVMIKLLIGEFVIAAAIFKLWAMVTSLLAKGTLPPNHDDAVFQLLAPAVVIYPLLAYDSVLVAFPAAFKT
jgi:hypothetical protein